jgi:CubicO group peptidase (beta-lactamase class C family)
LSITAADLNQLAEEVAAELGIVGAQVSVLHGGEVVEGVAGVADLVTQVPVTPDTLFQIGSTTKVYTAALVMQLAQEGKIDIDAPVAGQLPGFELSDPAATAAVTPRHLMSMSSGIDNGPYTDYGRGDDAVAKYVAALVELPQVFQPGTGYGYSNASTCVSGRLVEHVTGLTWDEALRTRLLEPAGLRDSATFAEDLMLRRVALGHGVDDEGKQFRLERWCLPRSKGPAGGTLCATAGDLVRFGHVFLHGGRSLEGTQVLPESAAEAMQAHEVAVPPTLLAEWWGLGPYGKVWDGVEVLGHSGTNLSGSSYLLWARGRATAIGTTVNTPGFGYPFAARMFRELFGTVAGIEVPGKVEPPPNVNFDPERLVGTYKMHGSTLTVARQNGGVVISGEGELLHGKLEPSRLLPLTPTTFLPTDPAIDGRRGWALAFIGADQGPATHLLNGFFALRRVA